MQYCNNEDLRALCDILVYDNKGELRLSESLSISDSYLSCYPDNMKGMWRDLAAELQCYGGNTLMNLFRHGHGPKYESIVYDVCQKMGVENVGKHDTAEDMEQKLLIAVSSKAMEEMTEEQIRVLKQVLAQDPRPSYQKDPERVYGMAYGGHEVKFRVEGECLTVLSVVPEQH